MIQEPLLSTLLGRLKFLNTTNGTKGDEGLPGGVRIAFHLRQLRKATVILLGSEELYCQTKSSFELAAEAKYLKYSILGGLWFSFFQPLKSTFSFS